MTDTVFRSSATSRPGRSPLKQSSGDGKVTADNIRDVEAPYLEYEKDTGEMFLIEHFDLSDNWRDNAPVAQAIKKIHELIKNEIEEGRIGPGIDAVKALLKQLEKASDLKDETRVGVRIEKTLAYLEFQEASEEIEARATKEAKRSFSDRPDIEHSTSQRPDLQKDNRKGGQK